jgi:hypothetical protein
MRRGTHGGVSDRKATLSQSLQVMLAIVQSLSEHDKHGLKKGVALNFGDIGETGIYVFLEQLGTKSEPTRITTLKTYVSHQVHSVISHARTFKHDRLIALDMLKKVT